MTRRSSKPAITALVAGHCFGVLAAIMGINSILTSIDPRYLRFFPLAETGIQQTAAGLISVGLFALALWLVTPRASRMPAKLDPSDKP